MYLSTHLRCAHFVESDTDEGLDERAESHISVEADRGSQEEDSLWDECQNANWKGQPGVLDQVQQIKVHGEVVSGVSSGDVVQIGLFDKLLSVSAKNVERSLSLPPLPLPSCSQ